MKLLIISDSHSNVDALNAVWAKECDSDYIIFAGDVLDFGFHPHESMQWLIEHRDKLIAVRGNHDEYILSRRDAEIDRNKRPQSFTEYTRQHLTEEDYDFLASIPHEATFTIADTDFYMCHYPDEISNDDYYPENQFSQRNIRGLLLERFAAKFPDASSPKKVVIWGHSHLQWVASAGDKCLMMNPGSLSYHFGSFESERCSDYIVWEDGNISLRHIDFDTAHLYNMADIFEDPQQVRLAKAFFRAKE